MSRTRIILADEHTLMIDGLKNLLQPEFDVVGTFSDGVTLVKGARDLQPDLIVLDTSLPKMNGLIAGQRLRALSGNAKLIYLTSNDNRRTLAAALQLGAKGYLLKSSTAADLIKAIRLIVRGSRYVTPTLTEDVVGSLTHYIAALQGREEHLTVRQKQVLQLLVEGRTMKEVAFLLNLSARTVAFHKYTMMQNLQIKSNSELLRFAWKNQLAA